MPLPEPILLPVRLALLVTGLLLPGAMLLRALRLPGSLAGAFAGSAATLYLLVLGADAAGLGISLGTLTAGLALVTAAARLRPVRRAAAQSEPWHACLTQMGGWTILIILFWLVVGWRLATQPLTGPDVHFRWSWLAEQIVRFGSLNFYPARSAEDFARYFWSESIPPGVASLYAWAYLCGGSTEPLWTAPVVALQLLALHELIWKLGHHWGGEIVARGAVVLAAAMPLLTWSVLIGQETGLTALGVGGLVWSLGRLQDADGTRWAVLAGFFAIVAASTREYGPVFTGATVFLALLLGTPRRPLLILAFVALPAALVWPLRVWWLTGNPVNSLDVFGLFPVNAAFVAWQGVFHAPHADVLADASGWRALGRYLGLWALPALVGAAMMIGLLIRRLAGVRVPAFFIVLTAALWWLALPFTAGGLFYSLRVLSPAFVLLAVLAAYGLTLWLPRAAGGAIALTAGVLLVESLPKTLVLPQNSYATAVAEWPNAGRRFSDSVQEGEQALLHRLAPLALPRRIVTDNASFQRLFASVGVEAVPVWSPEVAWVFDRTLPPDEAARRWQASGLRFLVLGKSASGAGYVLERARWPAPFFHVRTVTEAQGNLILEVTAAPP